MNDDKLKNYLYDLGMLLKERARQAKCDLGDGFKEDRDLYKIGYLMAFHEVIDLMKQQAEIFDIDQNAIGLADIEADTDLL